MNSVNWLRYLSNRHMGLYNITTLLVAKPL
jgi:hypothetical protein